MNVGILQVTAEVLVMTIPVIVVGAGGLLLLSRSRLGEAVARRIAGDSPDPAFEEQLDDCGTSFLGFGARSRRCRTELTSPSAPQPGG